MNFFFGLHWLDVVVLAAYLLGTTWIGHVLAGRQSTIRDFFLAGRSLPWPAVGASVIATELSGVTFIGVPAAIFAAQGNLTYLQWAIGSILGRIMVAWFFVPRFYEQEIYSPYDYMARRLGAPVKALATVLFFLGAILGQSVRVLVAAIPLRVVTGLPIELCIVLIGLFALLWTLMGGMRTVIWTDVVQFFVFAFGGLLAVVWIMSSLEGGWKQIWITAEQFGRTTFLDTRLQAHLEFTLWVALIAVPLQNLSVFGVDQMNAQRMFCCRGIREARLALIFSCAGQLLTVLMLCVGLALFAYYHHHPMGAEQASILVTLDKNEAQSGMTALEKLQSLPKISSGEGANRVESQVPLLPNRDYIFPIWIVQVLPPGLSGLVLAAIFAAAISSLDSVLGALSQTTLSLLYHPEKKNEQELAKLNLVSKARWLVVAWSVLLTSFTILMNIFREGIPILPLAFGMTSYAVGPLLGIMLCALTGRGTWPGLLTGTILSVLLVLFIRTDIWALVQAAGGDVSWLDALPTYNWDGKKLVSQVSYVWAWPVTTLITFASGFISWSISSKFKISR
jgi:SSS family solute:Na+ symporter